MDKLPGFIYLIADDYSIKYVNGYFNREFGKTDASTRCFSLMRKRATPCDPCPVQTVFNEQKEQVWIWEDNLRGKLYEVHDYPYWDTKGNLLALGLGINIDQRRKKRRPPEDVQRPQNLVTICCHCKNINSDNGKWQQIEAYLSKTIGMHFSHGICPNCALRYYPEYSPDKK